MTNVSTPHVVIIGAGQAGAETALRLRQLSFGGDITLIGDESTLPYQRPPLSKKYLSGEMSLERLWLRPEEVYRDEKINLISGDRVVNVVRESKWVRTLQGRGFWYSALVFATGARPRTLSLPGADLDGVHVFRSVQDADALRPRFKAGARLVVIGAGYIGLEAAAIARNAGLDVTVVEAAPRLLARVTSAPIADFFRAEHERQGVRFAIGLKPEAIEGDGVVEGVRLNNGVTLPADLVIIGVGVAPEVELARVSGLKIDNGILTDALCRSSDANVYAIGDCAARPIAHCGAKVLRLESVHNAVEGARIVASRIAGAKPLAVEAPWFWSDQYDIKLQIAGLSQEGDRVVLRGAPETRSFAAFYYRDDRLVAVDAVNRPAEFLGAKMVLQAGRSIPSDWVVDEARAMKQLAAAAV
jgi:3-phenylpropionate/trans-cinnamate dioxygenase ferredoxin reductase subunit